jgi:hypothetical protein
VTAFYTCGRDGEVIRAYVTTTTWSRHGARHGACTVIGRRRAGGRRSNGIRRRGRPAHGNVPRGTDQGPTSVMHREPGTVHGPLGTTEPRCA